MQTTELKRLRELLGYSQEQLAKKLSTTARTVQNWESGSKIPSNKMAILSEMAANFPEEEFQYFVAIQSPGAGKNNTLKGLVSKDLDKILSEMKAQRKDFMSQLAVKDQQIASLLEAQARFLEMLEKK